MTKRYLIRVARKEIAAWHSLPSGLVMAILWAFIEHAVNEEPFEQTYFKESPAADYEI